jgi:excisionase family DNA binding protein
MKLTVKQAAQKAGVSSNTVYAWCEDRLLTHFRLAARRGRRGKILIDEQDLDAYLESCRVEAGGHAPPARLRHITD